MGVFFGELLTPEDFIERSLRSNYANVNVAATSADSIGVRSLIEVPGSWHYAGYPRHGFATYRLVIKTYEPSLMVLLPQITSASVVWINGDKVLEAGTIFLPSADHPNQPMEVHGAYNIFVPFSPVDGQVEIIVQAANFTWFTAGLRTSIEMGTPENLIRDAMFRRVMLALFIGMLVAMFLYHILLFIYYKGEWVYFAFAVLCFLTSIKFILETDGILHLFWGRNALLRDLLQIVIILAGAALNVFTHLALRIPIGKIRGIVYAALFSIPILMIILLEPQMLDRRFIFIPAFSAPILFFSILRSTHLKGNYYKYLFLITLAVFFIGQPFNRLFFEEHMYYMFLVTPNLFVVLSHFLMLSVNFSEAKKAELEMDEMNKLLTRLNNLKSDFLANISHEMQAPLTLMRGCAEITGWQIDAGTVDDTTKGNLNTISDEAERLSQLVRQLLKISVEKDNIQSSIEVMVPDIMSQAQPLCRNILESKGNRIEVDIEKNCPSVRANPSMIIQVLINLAVNSNRHTKGGVVKISARPDGDMVIFQVQDSGTGISSEILPDIFKRGVSGDTASGGTGLGLPICKEAVEAHGGTIDIESRNGKLSGTTVTFTLPIYKRNEAS